MKLSVNEAKLTGLWARNCATIQKVLIWNFAFGHEKLPVLSRNRPLAMKFAFSVFLSFYGFCAFYSRSSARVALNYFWLLNPKRKTSTLKWPSSYVTLSYTCFSFDVKGTTYLQHILKHIKRAFILIPCFSSVWHGRKSTVEGLQKSQTLRKSKMVSVTKEHKQRRRRQDEKVKKTICLINKTTTLHVQDTFFVHFLTSLHGHHVKWLPFVFLILDTVR